jgi:tetratricopeptide (TPR) repeat protein
LTQEKLKFINLLEAGEISDAVNLALSAESERELFLAALGDYFLENKNLGMAKAFYSESLGLRANPAAEFGMGSVFLEEGLAEESLKYFRSCSRHEQYMVKSLLRMGRASRLLGDIEGALAFYATASESGYDKFILYFNMATLLCDMGRYDDAEKYYEKGISLAPDDAKARFNYSLHLLAKGEFKKGLEYYESRAWCFAGEGSLWSGEKDKRVLVLSEQGYGDLIHFARFLPALRSVSEKVALACDENISGLLRAAGIADEIVALDEESIKKSGSEYPFYCRTMSIPHLMGLDLKEPKVPYLRPDEDRSAYWRDYLSKDEGLKVGLCWQGGKTKNVEAIFNDGKRSIGLDDMAPVLEVQGVSFYSLQKNWKEFHPRMRYPMDRCGDFLDTASLVSNMDLVIAVDTSMAHLAGALGKPVWMMSRLGGDWRWGNYGEETFWYPSMRIFRQSEMNDWAPVVREVAARLSGLVSSRFIS